MTNVLCLLGGSMVFAGQKAVCIKQRTGLLQSLESNCEAQKFYRLKLRDLVMARHAPGWG